MSNTTDPFSNYLNLKTIQFIDQLDLPVMQKHHVRILAHCLIVLQTVSSNDMSLLDEEKCLKKWCNEQSQKFNDQKFNVLLYEQISSTTKKLRTFAQTIGKNLNDLDINDLVCLVKGKPNPFN